MACCWLAEYSGSRIAQLSQSLNAHDHLIAGLQEPRRLASEAHARGSAGGDHVARFEGEYSRQIFDQVRNSKYQILGIGLLQGLPVDGETDIQIVRVGDLIGAHD